MDKSSTTIGRAEEEVSQANKEHVVSHHQKKPSRRYT